MDLNATFRTVIALLKVLHNTALTDCKRNIFKMSFCSRLRQVKPSFKRSFRIKERGREMSCSSVKPSFCLVIEVFLGQHVGLPCFELVFQLSKPLTITRLSRSAAHSQTAQTSLMLKKGKPPNLSMKKLKSCSLNVRLCLRFSADIGSDASQLICLIHLALQFHIHFK